MPIENERWDSLFCFVLCLASVCVCAFVWRHFYSIFKSLKLTVLLPLIWRHSFLFAIINILLLLAIIYSYYYEYWLIDFCCHWLIMMSMIVVLLLLRILRWSRRKKYHQRKKKSWRTKREHAGGCTSMNGMLNWRGCVWSLAVGSSFNSLFRHRRFGAVWSFSAYSIDFFILSITNTS